MLSSLFSLRGRTALVTGGGSGLGKAMSRIFAEAGAEVVIASRNEERLRATADEIGAQIGARVEFLVADALQRDAIEAMADAAIAKFGKIDILVNNSGANRPQAIDGIRDQDWDELLELNLSSAMALTRRLAPGMKARRWGRVIHISSIMALGSTPGRSAYSATKGALLGLARASALDLGPYNITVNCLAPGPFATEMPMSILSKEQQDALGSRTALGRWGRPEELAGPALLLASDAGSYISGAVLVVDGGALARIF